MGNASSKVLIENENLFRALFSAPFGILFSFLAAELVMSSGLLLFKLLFVAVALYFSLTALAYAAYYTNERYKQSEAHH